ncbi:hypothetical protein HK104_003285, partial [Borealophlyctis nickersoniae]
MAVLRAVHEKSPPTDIIPVSQQPPLLPEIKPGGLVGTPMAEYLMSFVAEGQMVTATSSAKAGEGNDMSIDVSAGDQLRVETVMEDGRVALGTNLSTGKSGTFPLWCASNDAQQMVNGQQSMAGSNYAPKAPDSLDPAANSATPPLPPRSVVNLATSPDTPQSAPVKGKRSSKAVLVVQRRPGLHVAVRPYRAANDLEPSLNVGDEVEVTLWETAEMAVGVHLRTGLEGYFRGCILREKDQESVEPPSEAIIQPIHAHSFPAFDDSKGLKNGSVRSVSSVYPYARLPRHMVPRSLTVAASMPQIQAGSSSSSAYTTTGESTVDDIVRAAVSLRTADAAAYKQYLDALWNFDMGPGDYFGDGYLTQPGTAPPNSPPAAASVPQTPDAEAQRRKKGLRQVVEEMYRTEEKYMTDLEVVLK